MFRIRFLRVLQFFVSAVCLIVCSVLIVLWVRSYSWQEGLVWGITDKRGFVAGSMNGVLTVHSIEIIGDSCQLAKWFVDSYPISKAFWLQQNLGESTIFGFHLSLSSSGLRFIAIPHWFPVLLTAISISFSWIKWRFSLRSMFIATALFSVALGILVTFARSPTGAWFTIQ